MEELERHEGGAGRLVEGGLWNSALAQGDQWSTGFPNQWDTGVVFNTTHWDDKAMKQSCWVIDTQAK